MPRQAIEKVRRDRNAALVDAMLLVAVADGKVSDLELQTILRRVVERPEFEGTQSTDLAKLVEQSAARLAKNHDLQAILVSLRERLPSEGERRLAFGLAAAVAFAERKASRDELGLLKVFQSALEIGEADVVRIVEVVERGGSLAEALGEKLDRLCVEAMVLVSAADGELQEDEARELVEGMLSDPTFAHLSRDEVRQDVAEAVQALVTEGIERRLGAMARGLALKTHRLKAWALALSVARADTGIGPDEETALSLLQHAFGLSDEDVGPLRAQ